jgi:hypothetical protein
MRNCMSTQTDKIGAAGGRHILRKRTIKAGTWLNESVFIEHERTPGMVAVMWTDDSCRLKHHDSLQTVMVYSPSMILVVCPE